MLMITEQGDERSLTFKLAGRLAGEWTPELERCWRGVATSKPSLLIRIDLSEVTFVSDTGKRLLAVMARAGVELIAADLLMKALVEQIVAGRSFDEDIQSEELELTQ